MSTKSRSGYATVPDQPVREFSPSLESYFECLHRLLCQSLANPGSIQNVALICTEIRRYYYSMRELLENDRGISRSVSEALPLPVISNTLRELYALETGAAGQVEEKRPLPTEAESLRPHDAHKWKELRWCIFEAERILSITRKRIAGTAPQKSGTRYPWLQDPHLRFDVNAS